MTVRELMKQLDDFDPDREVVISDRAAVQAFNITDIVDAEDNHGCDWVVLERADQPTPYQWPRH